MNPTWTKLIVLALITLLAVIGYEFYLSVTGSNQSFDKTIPVIVKSDLGTKQLDALQNSSSYILVPNTELDDK